MFGLFEPNYLVINCMIGTLSYERQLCSNENINISQKKPESLAQPHKKVQTHLIDDFCKAEPLFAASPQLSYFSMLKNEKRQNTIYYQRHGISKKFLKVRNTIFQTPLWQGNGANCNYNKKWDWPSSSRLGAKAKSKVINITYQIP